MTTDIAGLFAIFVFTRENNLFQCFEIVAAPEMRDGMVSFRSVRLCSVFPDAHVLVH